MFKLYDISDRFYLDFRNKDKNQALAMRNILILMLKVLMDVLSRFLIFFAWMIIDNKGKFSPIRSMTSFYTMVGIMIIFNIVFNARTNVRSTRYWLGECCYHISHTFYIQTISEVFINSFSSTLRSVRKRSFLNSI